MGALGWVLLYGAAVAAGTFCAILVGKGTHLADHKAGQAASCACRYRAYNPRVSAQQIALEEARLHASLPPADWTWLHGNGRKG